MKNPSKVLAICNDLDNQKDFFRLSSDILGLEGRLESIGAASAMRSIAESLADVETADAVRVKLCEAASLISEESINALISEELVRFSNKPLYATTAKTIDSDALTGIVLFDSRQLRVSLVSLGPSAHRIKKGRNNNTRVTGVTMQGTDSAIRFIKSGNATLNLWSAPPFEREDPLSYREMQQQPNRKVLDGDTLFLEGGSTGMSIASCDAPILFTIATRNTPRTAVNAHYDMEGHLHSFTAADMRSSRIQLLATLIRELDWHPGVDHLITIATEHPDHFVRWHAMREAIALDPRASSPFLYHMADQDRHPQVRDAAAKTVTLIEVNENADNNRC
ncbi:MAG: hypothetical protein ACN6RK_04700 [Stenotrophomonas sp.]